MKVLQLMLIFCLFLLVSCQEDKTQTADGGTPENGLNAVCSEDADTCDMRWIARYPRHRFPLAIEIRINNKPIFNECKDLHFNVDRGTTNVEINMWNYRRITRRDLVFKFNVRSIPNCSEPEKSVTFDENNPQNYEFVKFEGEKIVLLEN